MLTGQGPAQGRNASAAPQQLPSRRASAPCTKSLWLWPRFAPERRGLRGCDPDPPASISTMARGSGCSTADGRTDRPGQPRAMCICHAVMPRTPS